MIRRGIALTSLMVLVLVLLPSQPAQATHLRWMLVKPPVGSYDGDSNLNQGWHSPSNGIDWDDEGDGTCCSVGNNVYFNSWLYRDSATTQYTLWIDIYQSNLPDCTRFRSRLKEYQDQSRIIGYLNYRHAKDDVGASNHGCQGNSAGIACRDHIGTMQETRPDPWDTCGWSGPHVHAEQTSATYGTWTRNVGNPPSAIPNAGSYNGWTYHNPGYETAVTERRLDWCNPDSLC